MTIDTNPQPFEEWLTARKQELDCFEAHWKDQQRLYGREDWPDEMTPGDWDEQYANFRGDDA